jgi:hypothetical protein
LHRKTQVYTNPDMRYSKSPTEASNRSRPRIRKASYSKFRRLYGHTLQELSVRFKVSLFTIKQWHHEGKLNSLKIADPLEEVFKINPRTLSILAQISDRCNNPNNPSYKYYGKKGIRNLLTPLDLATLWKRDKASKMVRPSIGRKDHSKHYCFENCAYVEMRDNLAEMHKRYPAKPKVYGPYGKVAAALGSYGGKARAKKYSKAQLSQWGKRGGRPLKKSVA